MSFLAPLMLAGAAAVSIPLALHFFYKARHRPLNWAAMKFLRQSIEETSRRVKFQEWILLALRCLALILLALAIARPTFHTASAAGRGEGVDAIFVFDTSFSMGARDGEQTRIERAKAAALTIINNLPPNSTVQVFTSAGTDRATQIEFKPHNLDQARNVVEGVQLTSLSGDILPGLNAAQSALDRGAGTNKEVYLFTDLQKSGWDRQAGALKGKANEIKQRATLILVRCGNPDRAVNNVAITDITFPASIPVAESRMPFTVLVKNTGKNPIRNVPVSLEVDGQKQDGEIGLAAEIGEGQTYPVTITAKLGKAGPRLLTARIGGRVAEVPGQPATPANDIQPDDLPGDNRFDKLILVRDRIRVLLVDGNPDPRDSKDSGSHFIRNALQPVPDSLRNTHFVRVTEVFANEASAATLGETDLCILVNVPTSDLDKPGIPALPREFIDRLPSYVREGGGLMIATGDFVVPARYNAVFGTSGNKLLPFDLSDVLTAKDDAPFKPASDTAAEKSFLAKFREEPFASATADVDVFKIQNVDEEKGGGSAVIRLNSGRPLICSKTIGEGEVLFFTTTLDTKWTNWPSRSGSYVSMSMMALAHLTGKAARVGNRVAGEPLVYTPPEATKPFVLEKPDRALVSLGQAQGGTDGKQLSVTFSDAILAGEYRIGYEGETPLNRARYAVVPDLRESENLESLTDAQVQEYVGFKPVMVTAGSEVESQIGAERSRREWTVWVLLLLFLVVAAEAGWAWFCGKAW